jgi:hypothetical protein
MTKRQIARWFYFVICFYFGILIMAIVLRLTDPSESPRYYTLFKDIVPVLIALPAVWLGYCFQRRLSYLQQLRGLWTKLVAAVQGAIQYTHLPAPTDVQFGGVSKELSIAIDEVRVVFKNLGEENVEHHLYPFEPLKDILYIVSELGYSSVESQNRIVARGQIEKLWKAVRTEMLKEFDREEPTYWHSHYKSPGQRTLYQLYDIEPGRKSKKFEVK